jgi:hypothetical protein
MRARASNTKGLEDVCLLLLLALHVNHTTQGPACDAKALRIAKRNDALLTRNGSEANLGLTLSAPDFAHSDAFPRAGLILGLKFPQEKRYLTLFLTLSAPLNTTVSGSLH